jgi:hypothetical protein
VPCGVLCGALCPGTFLLRSISPVYHCALCCEAFAMWSWSIVSYTALCHGQLCVLWSLLLSVTLCHVEHCALEPFGCGVLCQWIIVPCTVEHFAMWSWSIVSYKALCHGQLCALWSLLPSVTLCHVELCALEPFCCGALRQWILVPCAMERFAQCNFVPCGAFLTEKAFLLWSVAPMDHCAM